MDAIHVPACSSGTSAAAPIFTLTPANYSPERAYHYISMCFINSFHFVFLFFEFF